MSSKVRTVYYDQRLKWWESAPRYAIEMNCLLNGSVGKDVVAQVKNISTGGVFITSSTELTVGNEIDLGFESAQETITIPGKVLYTRAGGYGVQFSLDRKRTSQMKGLIKHLKQKGAHQMVQFSRVEDLKLWLKTKALQPAGWLPEVQTPVVAPAKLTLVKSELEVTETSEQDRAA